MPAAVAKGIIISITVIAALSIAVLENPQVQSWLEEQRRKIAELLRSVGQDLDPESRRRAEAFAYEGRNLADNRESSQEASPNLDAVAKATGRSLSSASTIRRIPVKGPADSDEAEERRRKGREYLAKRNQQMIEMQERRKASKSELVTSPSSVTSFDAMVDSNGNLRDTPLDEKELPSPPVSQPIPEQVHQEMKEVERQLQQPILAVPSPVASMDERQMESELATNPFGDEYALDRAITPRSRSPAQERAANAANLDLPMPGSFTQPQQDSAHSHGVDEGLTYEEQLAIAMSLSEQESAASAATVRQRTAKEDADLRRAIRASLKDLDVQHAAPAAPPALASYAAAYAGSSHRLVDLDPVPSPPIVPYHNEWETAHEPGHTTAQHRGQRPFPPAPPSETTDELYSITPELTHARLATFDAQQNASAFAPVPHPIPFNHFQAVPGNSQASPEVLESGFFSAASAISPPPSSHTLDDEVPQLIDVSEDAPQEGMRTPRSHAVMSTGFHSDFDSETLGSASVVPSRPESQTQSVMSAAELVGLEDDSDVDMMSEEGDRVTTPDSWSEVGSRDADSEMGDVPHHVPVSP